MKKQVENQQGTAIRNYRELTSRERQERRVCYDRFLMAGIAGLVVLVIALSLHVLANQANTLTDVEKPVVEEKEKAGTKTTQNVMAVASVVVEKETASEQTKEVEVVVAEPVEVKVASIYNPDIPMPKEHQEYLYDLCQTYGLSYKKTLAVIQHESVFDPNATNPTNDYGYFQINQVNHASLSEKLNTKNSPFNPYVNMQWGTYMLADLYTYWSEKGYHGQGLDDAVWSSYNRGKSGFMKNGHAVAYVNKMKASIETINSKF